MTPAAMSSVAACCWSTLSALQWRSSRLPVMAVWIVSGAGKSMRRTRLRIRSRCRSRVDLEGGDAESAVGRLRDGLRKLLELGSQSRCGGLNAHRGPDLVPGAIGPGLSIRVRSSLGAQVRVHREHGGRPGDTEWAPGHTELGLIDRGTRVDLDLIVDLPHGGPKFKHHPVADASSSPCTWRWPSSALLTWLETK